MIMDRTNKHSQNRSHKQLNETPYPQFNRDFQYTIQSVVFLSLYPLYITLKCQKYSAFVQFSPSLNFKRISLFAIQSLLIVMDISIQYTIIQWNPFSFASTLFMLVQYNDFMRLSSTIQFIHLIVSIQSLPIYRMTKYNTFLF